MNFTIITSFSADYISMFYNYPGFDFLSAFRAEGEPVTFQVGGDAFCGTAAFAGVPGGFDGLVYELSDILWSVVVVDSKSAKLLFDLRDLDGRVRVCGVEGIDGRRDFLDQRPPSLSALPGEVGDCVHYLSFLVFLQYHMISTASIVRPMKWPFGARSWKGGNSGASGVLLSRSACSW